MPDNYVIEFTKLEIENEFVKSFYFKKPENFKYRTGQFVVLRLMDEKLDSKFSMRQFSLSSSPYEEDLIITTTIKGRNFKFKENLDALAEGRELMIFGPNGIFFLEGEGDCLLLAGDKGITHFRSILLKSLFERKDTRFTLIHYCRWEHFRLFSDDFKKMPSYLLKIKNAKVDDFTQSTLELNDAIYQIKEFIDQRQILVQVPPL